MLCIVVFQTEGRFGLSPSYHDGVSKGSDVHGQHIIDAQFNTMNKALEVVEERYRLIRLEGVVRKYTHLIHSAGKKIS